MKKTKLKLSEGLHEIKNKKRPCAVRRKKEHLHLEGKRRHRVAKLVASLCAIFVIGVGAFVIDAFMPKNFVADTSRSASISMEAPTDGTTPMDYNVPEDGSVYKGIRNFAYINGQFRKRGHWYSEMHGTTVAGVMGINVEQSVNTWKQYSDDVLILVDITTSSMVNAARQFCYVGDDVIWRVADCAPDDYSGLETPWPDGEPFGHLSLEDFRKSYGLPGTELSVYVFNEENILYADPVTDNGDGTYTQTWYLDPDDDKAPYFYRYQMQKTGGLTGLPTFYDITVTYTFDASWNILESHIVEDCNAPMGVSADCHSDFVTKYNYEEEKAQSTAYEDYFNRFADKPASGEKELPLTATDCLSQAFGGLTSGSSSLDLALDLNGTPVSGVVNLSIGDELDVKARLGNINIWYSGDEVHLKYGNMRAKLSVPELMEIVQELLPSDGSLDLGASLDLNTILDQLVNDGEFVLGETTASLSTKLALFGLELPVDFEFDLGENRTVSLAKVSTSIDLTKDFTLGAAISFGDTKLPALEPGELPYYVELVPYVGSLVDLFSSETLSADIAYENEQLGLSVTGDLALAIKDGIAASGTVQVSRGEKSKSLSLVYRDGIVYLDLEGICLSANVNDALALIESYTGELLPSNAFDLADILSRVFTSDFATLFSLREENDLEIGLRGTQLLQALGVKGFDLGEVKLNVGEGTLTARALGATVSVSAGGTVGAAPAEGYVDIVKYAKSVSSVIDGGYLSAEVGYGEQDGFHVGGSFSIALDPFALTGELTLGYGESVKTANIAFAEGVIWLSVEGLRLKLGSEQAVQTVLDCIVPEGEQTMDMAKILDAVFSIDLTTAAKLAEKGDTLSLALAGDALLSAFGVDFKLGTVELALTGGTLSLDALGAHVTVSACDEFAAGAPADKAQYKDLTEVLAKLPAVLREKALGFSGDLTLVYGDTEGEETPITVGLNIKDGAIVWGDGFGLYLDAELDVLNTKHDLTVIYRGGELSVLYGEYGVKLTLEAEKGSETDLQKLEKAFLAVYNRIRDIVGKALPVQEEGAPAPANPLPPLQSFNDLLGLFKGAEAITSMMEGIDFASLIGDLKITAPETENGLFGLELGSIKAELSSALNDGLLGIGLNYRAEKLNVEATLRASARNASFAMPEGDYEYLGVEDFEDLLDYIGAAVALVGQEHLNIDLAGSKVMSTEEKYRPFEGVKYTIDGNIHYYSGTGFPFELNTADKTLVVNTDLFLQISFSERASLAEDKNLELTITVLDADPATGEADGTLDFYISASTIGQGGEGYEPLLLYAPADEIMTLLSGVCVMFGLDKGVINDYLVSKWIADVGTIEQLRGLGDALKGLLGNLLGVDFGATAAEGQQVTRALGGETRRGIIASVLRTDSSFTLALNSSVLYQQDGLDNITLTLSKERDEAGNTLLTALSLGNIYNKAGTEKTTVSLAITHEKEVDAVRPADAGNYFSVEAVDVLIKSLAKSITHKETVASDEVLTGEPQEQVKYVLNKNFYIEGSADLDLSLLGLSAISVKIRIIAISVNIDEDGGVAVNIQMQYDGKSGIINGDSVLDVTIKNTEKVGLMLYMKRTQNTDFSGRLNAEQTLPEPIVLYRALPLSNFMKNYVSQLGFMFNLADSIMSSLGDSLGGSSGGDGTTQSAPVDLGGWFHKFVSGCSYQYKDGVGDVWTLKINGKGLTGSDSFSDIVIDLGTDSEGYLRTIDASMDIASIVKIKANLNWKNPGSGAWGADITSDFASALEKGMSVKLRRVDWNVTDFLEGQLATVRYIHNGETIATQTDFVFNPTDHEAYGAFTRPSLAAYNDRDGYTLVWDLDSVVYGSVINVYSVYQANRYTLVFESDRPAADYEPEGEKWVKRVEWEYGTPLELPFAADESMEIVGFYCPDGQLHTQGNNRWHVYDQEEVVFTAKWEYIDYTVRFLTEEGGAVHESKTGHYGDPVGTPATNPSKEGYTFRGWAEWSGEETFSENRDIVAIFEPNQYEVTLVSDYELPEFAYSESSGKYERVIQFTYDEEFLLPQNVRLEEEGVVLNGFRRDGDKSLYVRALPNVLGATTFTAEWDEIGYAIVFQYTDEAHTKAETHNKHHGDRYTLEELPKIAENQQRPGYTASWDIDVETFTVTRDETIEIKYTPIEYTVYVYSRFPVDGFESKTQHYDSENVTGEVYYYHIYTYTYDSAAVEIPAGVSSMVEGYDFGGYFTARFGAGTRVNAIDSGVIRDCFQYRLGNGETLETRNVLYADWIDNSVTVHLYSDYDFAGSEGGNNVEGYHMNLTRIKDDAEQYNISGLTLTPKESGVQQLAWWYNDPLGGWRAVTDIEEFKDEDRDGNPVSLYAMWISNIRVKLSTLTEKLSRFDMAGVVKGGEPTGRVSAQIYASLSLEHTFTGVYYIYSADGKSSDVLNYGKAFNMDENGMFSDSGMTSLNGLFFSVKYAGIVVTATFNAGEQSVSTTWSAILSMSYHTVRVYDDKGLIKEEQVRDDFPYDSDDNSVSWADIFADIDIERVGYDYTIAEADVDKDSRAPITQDKDVHINYTPRDYSVRFYSRLPIGDWEAGEDGVYTFETTMKFDSVITVNAQTSTTYTVKTEGNEIWLPDNIDIGARKGSWAAPDIRADGAVFTANYEPDTVEYHSEVEFTYGGEPYGGERGDYTATYSSHYELITPEAAGYVFLGWFVADGASWKLVRSLDVADTLTTTKVEALWLSKAVSLTVTGSRSGGGWVFGGDAKHTISATLEGLTLVGAAKESTKLTTSFRFYANNNTNYEAETSHAQLTFAQKAYGSWVTSAEETVTPEGTKQKDYGHAVVVITVYDRDGEELGSYGEADLHGVTRKY